jgi:hypothetical protein
MKSLEKLIKLADKFERKIAQFSQESNQGPVIEDAFFGEPSPGFGHPEFVKRLNKPDSNFQHAAATVQGQITIGCKVDAASGFADFTVAVNPAPKDPKVVQALKAALVKDFVAMYKKTPMEFLKGRLAVNQIRPPTVSGETVVTTM